MSRSWATASDYGELKSGSTERGLPVSHSSSFLEFKEELSFAAGVESRFQGLDSAVGVEATFSKSVKMERQLEWSVHRRRGCRKPPPGLGTPRMGVGREVGVGKRG